VPRRRAAEVRAVRTAVSAGVQLPMPFSFGARSFFIFLEDGALSDTDGGAAGRAQGGDCTAGSAAAGAACASSTAGSGTCSGTGSSKLRTLGVVAGMRRPLGMTFKAAKAVGKERPFLAGVGMPPSRKTTTYMMLMTWGPDLGECKFQPKTVLQNPEFVRSRKRFPEFVTFPRVQHHFPTWRSRERVFFFVAG
jgi:hypothetical protein